MLRLDVPYNQLTGTIPSELGNLEIASTIYGQQNYLTGTMPSEICDNVKANGGPIKTLVVDCKSEIICSCCSVCL